jgi:hypothetical protein
MSSPDSDSDEDLFIPIQYDIDHLDKLIEQSQNKVKIPKIVKSTEKNKPKKKKQVSKKRTIQKSPEDRFLEEAIEESKKNASQTSTTISENTKPQKLKKGVLWKKLQEKKADEKMKIKAPNPKEEAQAELGKLYYQKKQAMKQAFLDGSQKRATMIPKLDAETEKQIAEVIAGNHDNITDYVYHEMKKTVTAMTEEIIGYSVSTDEHVRSFTNLLDFERNLPHKEVNTGAWLSMCKLVHQKFKHKTITKYGKPVTDSVEFYQEMLKQYVGQGMLHAFDDYIRRGIFDKFKPDDTPLAFFSIQKDFSDVFPEIDMIVSLKHLIAHNLAPHNAAEFNPFNNNLLGFAIFWSFSFDFNLFGGFFRSPEGKLNFYWINYNRLTESVNELLTTKQVKDLRDAEVKREPIVEEKKEEPPKKEIADAKYQAKTMEMVDNFVKNLDSSPLEKEEKLKLVSSMKVLLTDLDQTSEALNALTEQ